MKRHGAVRCGRGVYPNHYICDDFERNVSIHVCLVVLLRKRRRIRPVFLNKNVYHAYLVFQFSVQLHVRRWTHKSHHLCHAKATKYLLRTTITN